MHSPNCTIKADKEKFNEENICDFKEDFATCGNWGKKKSSLFSFVQTRVLWVN